MSKSDKDDKVAENNTGDDSNRIKYVQLKLHIIHVQLAQNITDQVRNSVD